MGTEFRIVLYHGDSSSAQKAAMAAFDRVEDLEDIFSDYRERSEVNRLCQVAVGKAWNISPELFFVLEASLRYSRLSNGAFDVTIGPVVQLWRQARKSKRLPDPAELEEARRRVGYSNIVLNPADHTAMLKLAAMKIDFGAIAKGYAADQALEVLRSRGITRALVAGGGDIAVGAPPPDSPGWSIEILKPEAGSAGNQGYLTLHDAGVATSGDIYQFVEIGGLHYSHIINPSTGMAVTDAASATVVAPNGMTADAFSTTLCVLPPADGLRLIESVPGVSALMVRRSPQGSQRFKSAGFPQITASAEAPRTGQKQN
jgi:thiamine biosynthesis lipoprotein